MSEQQLPLVPRYQAPGFAAVQAGVTVQALERAKAELDKCRTDNAVELSARNEDFKRVQVCCSSCLPCLRAHVLMCQGCNTETCRARACS